MEESGRVDDEGRPVLEKVDLMEAFSAASTGKSENHVFSCRRRGINRSFTGMIVVHIETHRRAQNKNRLDGLVVSFLAI